MCFLSAKIATAARRTDLTKKTKDYGINTDPSLKAIFYSVSFWFFICLRWKDAYKNSQLCKSSFVSLPVVVWQFVLSAVICFLLYLLFRRQFSAGIFVGVVFITVLWWAVLFIGWLQVGLFGVFHLAAASFVHCPFRGFA
jgi:hypothetical protein